MRKYYKLTLLVVTIVSVVCLVFYKTQYDKLYNVLEVLEFFEGAPNKRDPKSCSKLSSSSWVPPSFHRVTDSVFVFSAFCRPTLQQGDHGQCGQVLALALVDKRVQRPQLANIRCRLWYEGSIQPIEGIFSPSKVQGLSEEALEASKFVPYHFNCESKFSSKIPFGIALIDSEDQAFVHVEPTVSDVNPFPNSIGACILPQSKLDDSTLTLTENILLNNYFGIKNFFIYDVGVTHKFLETIDEFHGTQDPAINVKIMPWNPPGSLHRSVLATFIKTDCFLRAHPLWESITVLEPTQIVVPGSPHKKISDALSSDDFASSHVGISVLNFCSELPSDDSAAKNTFSITALEQLTYDKVTSKDKFNSLMNKIGTDTKEKTIPTEQLAVHDYGPCGQFDFAEESLDKVERIVEFKSGIEKDIGAYFPHKSV